VRLAGEVGVDQVVRARVIVCDQTTP
jgi:hypothetical protein